MANMFALEHLLSVSDSMPLLVYFLRLKRYCELRLFLRQMDWAVVELEGHRLKQVISEAICIATQLVVTLALFGVGLHEDQAGTKAASQT